MRGLGVEGAPVRGRFGDGMRACRLMSLTFFRLSSRKLCHGAGAEERMASGFGASYAGRRYLSHRQDAGLRKR